MSIESTLLATIASVTLFVAVYFSIKLSRESGNEKYWIVMSIGFIIFAAHHWLMHPFQLGFVSEETMHIIQHVTSAIAALLLAYSIHGLYTSMRKVKEKLR